MGFSMSGIKILMSNNHINLPSIRPAHHQTPPPRSHKPPPAAASEPDNRRTKPESHKHQQERPITNRSGQQYPGEIAAGGPATPEGLPGKEYASAVFTRVITPHNPGLVYESIIAGESHNET